MDTLPSEAMPPRTPYQAEYLQNLPDLPAQCPRCRAQLFPCLVAVEQDYVEAVQCYNCAFQVDKLAWKNKLESHHAA
jgi:Zn ribbon nucleic-acid-binding protein